MMMARTAIEGVEIRVVLTSRDDTEVLGTTPLLQHAMAVRRSTTSSSPPSASVSITAATAVALFLPSQFHHQLYLLPECLQLAFPTRISACRVCRAFYRARWRRAWRPSSAMQTARRSVASTSLANKTSSSRYADGDAARRANIASLGGTIVVVGLVGVLEMD